MIGAKSREFTGTHMAMIIGAFFGTIITVNLMLAYFAVNTWTGLVVKNSYVASQHFNERLADGRRMKALGWSGALARNGNTLEFRLLTQDNEAIPGASVTAKFMRPTHETEDRMATFAAHAPGLYKSDARLAPGAWDIDIQAKDQQGHSFRRIYRVIISGGD
jgi:nitrogen fixation protein FixH